MLKSDENKQQQQQDEEDYKKALPKIGRDFVYIEDLASWMLKLQSILAPLGIILPPITSDKAVARATLYKEDVQKGNGGDSTYKDLVEFDNEDDEDV